MEPTPTASDPKIPTIQQEAQDTVFNYLQRTVDGLAPGTRIDSSDARGARNRLCDDNYMGPGPGPTRFSVWSRVVGPVDVPAAELIESAAGLWRSWGLKVMKRDGIRALHWSGYADDGYRLQIRAVNPPDGPPEIIAISPCFPGEIRDDSIPFPKIIGQNPDG